MKGKEVDVDIGLTEGWDREPLFQWWDGMGIEACGRHQVMKEVRCSAGRVGAESFEAPGQRSRWRLGPKVRVGMSDAQMMVRCGHRA